MSGPIGRHGMAVMAVREGLEFDTTITSDTACLVPLVAALRAACGDGVRVLRDPTRGGVATVLNELAQASGVGIVLDERSLPVPDAVGAACAVLGLDPLSVANEGILVALVAAEHADAALRTLRLHPLGAQATLIGTVADGPWDLVQMRTTIGGRRVVDQLPGDQLPRIC